MWVLWLGMDGTVGRMAGHAGWGKGLLQTSLAHMPDLLLPECDSVHGSILASCAALLT